MLAAQLGHWAIRNNEIRTLRGFSPYIFLFTSKKEKRKKKKKKPTTNEIQSILYLMTEHSGFIKYNKKNQLNHLH